MRAESVAFSIRAHIRHRGMAEPLLGHEAHAERPALVRPLAADRLAIELDGIERGRAECSPISAAISSSWPLPATPATPRISPARISRATSVRSTPNGCSLGKRQAVEPQPHGAAPPSRSRLGGIRMAPIIISARLFAVSSAGDAGGDDLAAAQDGGVMAERADLLELVRDVEDRAALGGEAAERREQHLDLLRGEHRGRLVHDDQARVLQQAADDLDALALADRELADQARRVELQSVIVGDLDDPAAQVALWPAPG